MDRSKMAAGFRRVNEGMVEIPLFVTVTDPSRKNAHFIFVASMLWVVGPTNHSGSGLPPGQECPPPSIR
ncbi:MAG: hypothetical protein NVS4B3_25440 [Gemmatimonadaceae bacterium]